MKLIAQEEKSTEKQTSFFGVFFSNQFDTGDFSLFFLLRKMGPVQPSMGGGRSSLLGHGVCDTSGQRCQ